MSKYKALEEALAYAKQTGGIGLTASVADLDALLADLERAEKALKVARAYIARYGYTGEQLAIIDAALAQMAGGG